MINNKLHKYLKEIDMYTDEIKRMLEDTSIPIFHDLNYNIRSGYLYNGYYKYESILGKSIYLVKNLPVSPNIRLNYNGRLDKLIYSCEIRPFIIFINNKFIKWSDIYLIIDSKNTYFSISNIEDDSNPELKCILLPNTVNYEEKSNNNGAQFIFSKDGYLIDNVESDCTTIELINSSDIFFRRNTAIFNNSIQTTLPIDYSLTEHNLFIFDEEGRLISNEIEMDGYNTFTVKNDTNNKYKYLLFYNMNIISKDIITKIPNKDFIKEYIKNLQDSNVKDLLLSKFKLNSTDTLKNVMEYDSSLLNDYYKNNLGFTEEIVLGKDFKARSILGYVTIHRKNLSSNIMIFKNRKLYEHNRLIKVESDKILIPDSDIEDDDVLDIIYFTEIYNEEIKTVFDSNTDDYTYYLNDIIPINDVQLFCNISEYEKFNIGGSGVQYEIEHFSEKLENDKYSLLPKDHFYFDKEVTIASKKKFEYYSKIINNDNTHSITLPKTFDFCNDIERYMIFVDGVLINRNNIMITTSRIDRPFFDKTIYFDISIKDNSIVDIYYLPINISLLENKETIPDTGFINVNINKLDFNLTKDLHFIFVDGKKLIYSDLYDVKTNTIRLINNIGSLSNVCVYRVFDEDKDITNLFKSITSIYDQFINMIDDNILDEIYNKKNILLNDNIQKYDVIEKKSILYEIIKKYYILPAIYKDNGKEIFDYTYEGVDEFENYNSDTNLITYIDGNLEDKL